MRRTLPDRLRTWRAPLRNQLKWRDVSEKPCLGNHHLVDEGFPSLRILGNHPGIRRRIGEAGVLHGSPQDSLNRLLPHAVYIEPEPRGEKIFDVGEGHASLSANKRSRTFSGSRFSTFTY